ncbi:MAG TPA: hypothetical protein VFV54_05210, partial [Thermoanaerobaculia bacterium]|nr:hypothetical protein [Thermoanaerobaculia bacterium]
MSSTDGRSPYGHFSDDHREFIITDPRTPRPWANVIANPRFGLAVAQSGSGFTWIDNSQLAVVNVWQQDFAQDTSGKFLYARDAESGATWSLAPAPVWAPLDAYACRHGIGYTTFELSSQEIASEWTLFPHESETVEIWIVRLRNLAKRPRRLELTGYLEWCCGVSPAPRREFHKLFIETLYDPAARAVFGANHMWDIPSKRWGHWNTSFPYICAFGSSEPIVSAEGEKSEFLGRNGSLRDPAALAKAEWRGTFGRHADPIAAIRVAVELPPGGERELAFTIAVDRSRDAAEELIARWAAPAAAASALEGAKSSWKERLAAHRIEGGGRSFDALINDWVRYQAISAR